MHRHTSPRRSATAALVALALALGLASAGAVEWAIDTKQIPVARLVANLTRRVAAAPDDAAAHYTLARVHSVAYSRALAELTMVPGDEADKSEIFVQSGFVRFSCCTFTY